MSILTPVNPDLPSSYMIPGVYFKIDTSGTGSALNSIAKRLIILGHKTSAGTASPNTPIQTISQSQADAYAGRGSDLARAFAAAQSHAQGAGIDIFLCPIPEPVGGVAATSKIIFANTATGPGSVDVFITGYKISTAIATGDTATVVGAAVAAAINENLDIPVTAGAASGTVTLTYRHASACSNDCPVIVNMNGSTGVTASAGQIVITGAAGAGSVTINVAGQSVTVPVAGAESNNTTATNIAAAINALAFPVTATAATNNVHLFFQTDRVVHKVSAAAGATGLTLTTTSFGTIGSGAPSLTAALSTLQAQLAYKGWVSCFNDATSINAIIAHIELMANGLNQKGQRLCTVNTDSLTSAGTISLTLTDTPRNNYSWHNDSPQQAYELAAREIAARVLEDYAARNYDGVQLKTSGTVPLLLPHPATRPSATDKNAAMYTYRMTPYEASDATGAVHIVRGRTSSRSSDQRLWDYSTIDTLDFYRYDLATFLTGRFFQPGAAKSLRLVGTSKTSNTVTLDSIKDAVIIRMLSWDDNDLFDGADELKKIVSVSQDSLVPTRVDVGVPAKPPVNLHQLAGNVNLQ